MNKLIRNLQLNSIRAPLKIVSNVFPVLCKCQNNLMLGYSHVFEIAIFLYNITTVVVWSVHVCTISAGFCFSGSM